MLILIGALLAFLVTLAWLAFISWVVGNLAYRGQPPARRAALTAATSVLVTLAIDLVVELAWPEFLTVRALLFLLPAAFCDFLMMRRGFAAAWVPDEEVGEVFN
jgi:hypothetical protein